VGDGTDVNHPNLIPHEDSSKTTSSNTNATTQKPTHAQFATQIQNEEELKRRRSSNSKPTANGSTARVAMAPKTPNRYELWSPKISPASGEPEAPLHDTTPPNSRQKRQERQV